MNAAIELVSERREKRGSRDVVVGERCGPGRKGLEGLCVAPPMVFTCAVAVIHAFLRVARCRAWKCLRTPAAFICVGWGALGLGCARDPATSDTNSEVTLFAAASLREGFETLGAEFMVAHPATTLRFNFAGTQELSTQVQHGARADVFASADTKHSDELVQQGLIGVPRLFAEGEPVLVVSRDRSATVSQFSDLPNASRIVLGVPDAPIGRYSNHILNRAGGTLGADFRARVEAHVVSRELNVRQVLTKVTLGEADAGIVYRSDVGESVRDKVAVVAIPAEFNVLAEYTIAVVEGSQHLEGAEQWVSFVLSEVGQEALTRIGFRAPMAKRAD